MRLTMGGVWPVLLTLSLFLTFFDVGASLSKEELDKLQAEIREDVQKVFGVNGQNGKHIVLPQYLMDLYNTVADSSGVTRGSNLYNSNVVRCFFEKNASLSDVYHFELSGLGTEEKVLEAQLYLRIVETSGRVSPTAPESENYLIKVYQVLEGQSLDSPQLHKLLNIVEVSSVASGTQLINVTQVVTAWLSGEKNLGLMVTVWNSQEQRVNVEFYRGNMSDPNQAILVLFDDDESIDREFDEDEETAYVNIQQNQMGLPSALQRVRRDLASSQTGVGTSMDISSGTDVTSTEKPNDVESTTNQIQPEVQTSEDLSSTNCTRHKFFVNFLDVGLSDFIVAPHGFDAYFCMGHCQTPAFEDLPLTRDGIIRSAFQKVRMLRHDKNPRSPCCVPTGFDTIKMIILDNDTLILENYHGLAVHNCKCR